MLDNFKKAFKAGYEVRYESEKGGLWVKLNSPKWDLPADRYKVALKVDDELYHWEELNHAYKVIEVTNGVYYFAILNGASSKVLYESKSMFNDLIGKNWFFNRESCLDKHIEGLQSQIEYYTGKKHEIYKVMADEEQAVELYNQIVDTLSSDNQKSCAMGIIRSILSIQNSTVEWNCPNCGHTSYWGV